MNTLNNIIAELTNRLGPANGLVGDDYTEWRSGRRGVSVFEHRDGYVCVNLHGETDTNYAVAQETIPAGVKLPEYSTESATVNILEAAVATMKGA